MKKTVSTVLLLLFSSTLLLSACSGENTITVGAQTYSETKTIGFMYKELIEANTDLSVNVKTDMSTDTVILKAMMNDEVDIATSYTGTALTSFFSMKYPKDRDATLKQTKNDFADEYNIKVLDPLGFANTYAIGVTQEFSEKNNINAISDLKDIAGDLTFVSDTSWMGRKEDGYKAFTKLYGFKFGETKQVNNLQYKALKNNEADAGLVYSTDARIDSYNLTTLNDNKNFFPPYDAVPFVRQETLDNHPEIKEVFSSLIGKLDLDTIRKLNHQVDVEGEDPHDVAVDFLKKQDMLN
ncbi:osmoprotectant ABC transporter substrate-binding lipoprotein OpuCC [Lentibacillus halophilus]|uniref:Osmoprotectant ABC transporter substrate-binding lipoprotein OpuCC n=1 Tax=Lentibacillus halophilus TaxID=295065 RepID=A0ABN0Z7H4_9BACI